MPAQKNAKLANTLEKAMNKDDVSKEPHNGILKFVLVAVVVLIVCVIAISVLKKYKSTINPNIPGEVTEFYTETIFDDIKIKMF